MRLTTQTFLLAIGTLPFAAVSTNGQVLLAPAGQRSVPNSCPQGAMLTRLQNQPPYMYPMNVLVALEQFNQDKNGSAQPADAPQQPPGPRCRPEASRVFTKLFSIPGAVADSLLSGEIII